ncbi:hypothetical protein BDP81DRAFT_327722 [Colletotrichum phormii]|uniref:Vacuolar protein sorting-associated protein 9a n=1 Tax=Colletotrichum phormii TaxID=359342 RepID=A0AAJ0EAS8_9PEZI|nr:uncharacterized protein BDP81DRAFT_327722 [Colletotrichum phormii]KAK1625424.1 hypothetical protein BDP81DRAFT_327722 [Colletotrichum phormii]
MSSTDPTDHSSGLSGAPQNDTTAALVTNAETAGSKAETELPKLDNHVEDEQPVLSAKAAGKQQATDDLIDFGEDTPVSTANTKDDTKVEDKPSQHSPKTTSKPAPVTIPEPMTSSIATLKPTSPLPAETATQFLTIESTTYVDPTPPTPRTSQPPSRTPSNAKRRPTSASPTRSDAGYDEHRYASEDEQENGSRSEIQSIMEQFTGDGGGPGAEEVMSPRLEIASPMLGSPGIQHPPRKSSLEPLVPSLSHQVQELQGLRIQSASPASMFSKERATDEQGPPVPPKDGPPATPARSHDDRQMSIDSQMSPSMPVHRPPPPEPEPEPALPFDFHRFLEQLRNKKADPVARYLKSFLSEFGKRQWMVHEQVKIIGDFLAFIANKMAQCEVWRDVSDAEFDNAREGMEKLVMNRLYTQTFSPAIPPPQPIPGAKPKRRGGERPMGPGRRGQHQEDVERDDILTQKINIYAWLREEHLDIPPAGDSGKRFLKLAQQEILKIKSYRAPRDKIICVLNCCKVIFGLLKHSKSDSSADSFMPLLIYVVLQANPEHLVSNVQYILRFRNQEKLGGEAGYYLSSLMGAIQFIENMDRTTLTITDEEFEKNVEAAVSAIAEKHRLDTPAVAQEPVFSEKSSTGYQTGESSTRPSLDIMGESSTPRRSTSSNEGGKDSDDQAPITGLLRSIQKPLSTIGRMFSDEPSPAPPVPSNASRPTSRPRDSSERLSPRPSTEISPDGRPPSARHHLSAEEAAARQASAEVAEAQRLSRVEHNNVVETLQGMFPDLDREIISDVVHQKQGRVGQAVDACLALST